MLYSRYAYILYALVLFTSSCNTSKGLLNGSSWEIEFSKGSCMDVCESYEINIDNNRKYTYKGFHNVKYIGEKSGLISEQKFSELKILLKTLEWDEYKAQYGSPGTGIQRKELSFTSELKDRRIAYYRTEPQEIRALELFIDKLIESDDI